MRTILSKVFSVQTEREGALERKVITILGLKAKYICFGATLKNLAKQNNYSAFDVNKNLCNLLLALSLNDTELLYLKTHYTLIIFSKTSLIRKSDFVRDFLFRHCASGVFFQFGVLSKESELYRRHKGFLARSELIYKYARRNNNVAQTIISVGDDGELYFEQKYLGKPLELPDEGLVYKDTLKRKIIDGGTLGSVLLSMKPEEKEAFLIRFYDWLFATYESPRDKNKVSGKLFDCHFGNFLVSDDGFHFIDEDIVSAADLDKAFCLACPFCRGGIDVSLYKKLIEHYGFEDKTAQYRKQIGFLWKDMSIRQAQVKEANASLMELYFSDKGLVAEHELCSGLDDMAA